MLLRLLSSWVFLVLVCICLLSIDAGKQTPQKQPQTPAAGWCHTRHRPNKPAQSGYDGYCKACYQDKFPKKYLDKQLQRKKQCAWCAELRDTIGGKFCKPCFSARSCEECSAVNTDNEAVSCVQCCTVREKLGATQSRFGFVLCFLHLCIVS